MAIEQVQRSFCVVNKGKGEPVSGGYTEETWEGTWTEMCAYAERQSAAGGDLWSVTATVTRKDGNFAECRIRRQAMDGKEEGQVEMPGGTRDNPQYSLSVTCVPQPILTHPLAESFTGEKLDALKRLVNGGCMGSLVDVTKDGQPLQQKTVRSILGDEATPLIEKIKKGVTSFYSPQIVLQVRYKVTDPGSISYQKACTIATPPGPFESPDGNFNWLSMGTSVEGYGKDWQVTDSYMLSGPDGWDKDIYKS